MPGKLALSIVSRMPGFLRSPVIKLLRRRLGPEYQLNAADFQGLRVLILGPARTVGEDLACLDPARFDVFVRLNNGLDMPIPALGQAARRCDVLFHSLTSDTRPVTAAALEAAGVQVLVHRTPTKGAFLQTLIAARCFPRQALRHIPWERYRDLQRDLGGASPTSGLICADFFLRAPVQELAIVGFTFFTTCYNVGYEAELGTDDEARQRVAGIGHHDPAREALLLADLVDAARGRGRHVVLGEQVEAAMARLRAEMDVGR
ncbi:hypothetical protein [Paracoccus sp. PAR01]|uniref:hypothetical protein n=1 Tax=Paracoccus sp. PAR01 TaxID=2769282 RepID=UPI001782D80A|nr:hypothetical protein [Paracoccus sp. PAR01]MBD9528137.1 hypothetical protein [Paracoccus sp. PAR01]